MKKIIYFVLITISFSSFAQIQVTAVEEAKKSMVPKNEFKIDAFDLAFLSTLDISYERVDNSSIGYGASLLLGLNEEDIRNEKLAITPFFRMYFFDKTDYGAKGFFAEVYSKFVFGELSDIYYDSFSSTYKESNNEFFDISLGMGLGWKWVSKNGFILDVSLGGGRYLGIDENSPEFSLRGGVSLGYRF